MASNDAYKGQLLIRGGSLSTVWPWRLVVFSFSIFAAVLIIYAGLTFWYRPTLERQVALTDTEIAQLAETVPKEEQERFLRFYGQLLSLQEILTNHVATSRVFAWMEANTNAQVFFPSFDINVLNREAALEGVADSFEVLAQQLEVYRTSADLESFFVSQSQLGGDGRVTFRASLTFTPQMFQP